MRFLTARRLVLAALLPALFVFSAVPGCSNESEGERCGDDPTNPSGPGTLNNDDCSAPLVCVAAARLVNNQANRCCNSNPNIVNDSRCLPSVGTRIDAGADPDANADADTDADTDAAAGAGSN